MKKFTFLFLAIFLALSCTLMAQTKIVVEPGVGTLNAAIAAHGGDAIYELKAGEWYQLDAVIENNGYHLQIIGQEPAVAGGIPATLQTGDDAGGAAFGNMFNALGDITLKNIYFVNADLTGVIGNGFLTSSATNARTVVDRCIIDPVGLNYFANLTGGNSKTYFTNNQALRHGHQLNPNDGHFFITDNASGVGFDTLLVQNNTFVCMGTTMHASGFNKYTNNFSKWDHNTFVEQKSQIDWSNFEKEYYWTNNLMFDMQTQPWNTPWQPMPGADAGYPKPCLIYADTIPEEVASLKAGGVSTTLQFVEYNMHYKNPKFYPQIDALNAQGVIDGKTKIYYMPIVWPIDSAGICRETAMFANDSKFPLWKYGNTTTDVDPNWVDARIYTMSDNLVKWTLPATQIHAMGYPAGNFPPASEWTQWHWDPDGDVSLNSTWPVFNGVYTNAAMLTGSIEGLPLGDLNWFPASKSKWTQHKAEIDAHMAAANDSKITVWTGIKNIKADAFSIYPNPAKDVLKIKGAKSAEVIIRTIDGRRVKTVENASEVNISDLANGTYIVTIKEGKNVSTQKLLIQK